MRENEKENERENEKEFMNKLVTSIASQRNSVHQRVHFTRLSLNLCGVPHTPRRVSAKLLLVLTTASHAYS